MPGKEEKVSQKAKREWRVGDLCRYGETIFRVREIGKKEAGTNYQALYLSAVFAFSPQSEWRDENVPAVWCHPVTLLDLAVLYTKFGNFIAEEARLRGEDDGTAADVLAT